MMKNNKLIICLIFLFTSTFAMAQNTDFQVMAVSPVPFALTVGEQTQIYIDVGNLGQAIPIGGVRVQISVSGQLDLENPLTFTDQGCYGSGTIWAVTFAQRIGNNTEVVMKNMLGVMGDAVSCSMIVNFVGTSTSCTNCGVITCNSTLTPESGMGDVNGFNNSATGNFTVSLPLPIKLGDFYTKINDCSTVDIMWNTYSEENFEKAEVQKSIDGKNYISIGTVKTKGNGTSVNNSYLFTDNSPLVSGTIYYRLKVIDLDKTYTYSRVATAIVNCDNAMDMNIYPNPTHGQASVSFSGFKTNNMREVLLLNVKGDIVRSLKMDPLANNNLNINDLPSGIYFLKLVDETNVIQKKFVKIN